MSDPLEALTTALQEATGRRMSAHGKEWLVTWLASGGRTQALAAESGRAELAGLLALIRGPGANKDRQVPSANLTDRIAGESLRRLGNGIHDFPAGGTKNPVAVRAADKDMDSSRLLNGGAVAGPGAISSERLGDCVPYLFRRKAIHGAGAGAGELAVKAFYEARVSERCLAAACWTGKKDVRIVVGHGDLRRRLPMGRRGVHPSRRSAHLTT